MPLQLRSAAWADPVLPVAAAPEDVGLSSSQLARIEAVTQKYVDSGLVPGAVMLVARRGKIAWTRTMGFRDRAAKDPMRPDSIFRIYSMTKPIVSVAAMMLVEEGRMQVSDPVSKYHAGNRTHEGRRRDHRRTASLTLQLTDPARAMTVQDLLRHTSGLIYGTRGKSLVNAAYIEAKIGSRDVSNEEFVAKLSKLPLRFSPGDRWEYGVSTDVLGRVVEVVSGKTLGEFLNERVLTPLGMTDTGFYRAAGQAQSRRPALADAGSAADDAALRRRAKAPLRIRRRRPHLHDRRLSSLCDHGRRWRRIRRQAPARQQDGRVHDGGSYRRAAGRPPGLGFGLGFEVRTSVGDSALPGSLGEYGWAGNAGTLFWIDPKEQLIAIYMVQVDDGVRIMLRNQFRTMVQSAIIN